MKIFMLLSIISILIISCGTTIEPEIITNPPSDLVVFSNILDQVQLEWQDNSNVEIGFIIERKIFDSEYTIIDTVAENTTFFLDENVEVGNYYFYRIAAHFPGEISDYTNEVSINLTSCSPTNLTIYNNINYDIILNWEDRCVNESGFVISRKTNNFNFVIIDTANANITNFIDENVEVGNNYNYRVAVLLDSTISSWSNEVSLELNIWFEGLEFGTDQTLDIITWNIEHFPKANQITVDYLTQLILVLDAEVYALQEIESESYFDTLIVQINMLDTENTWSGYRASTASYSVNLAYIYKTNVIQINDIYEIYASYNYSREFPRRPLMMEMQWNGTDVYIINNHLKAMGDGYLDLGDEWDEETRRFDACNLLDEYISQNLPDENVIVLGDLNDELTDSPSNNVFVSFLNETDEYDFTDMEIAEGSSVYWSYPSWPSHLDHILITNELFDEFILEDSDIQTLRIDVLLDGGWSEYDNNISDHRPVGLKLAF